MPEEQTAAKTDKFSAYTIEMMKAIMLINGVAIIAITTVIRALFNTPNQGIENY